MKHVKMNYFVEMQMVELHNDIISSPIRNSNLESEQKDNKYGEKELSGLQSTLELQVSANKNIRKSYILNQLKTGLSPKLTDIEISTAGKRSKYGRKQIYKEAIDFLPSDILRSPRRINTSLSPKTSTRTKLKSGANQSSSHILQQPPERNSPKNDNLQDITNEIDPQLIEIKIEEIVKEEELLMTNEIIVNSDEKVNNEIENIQNRSEGFVEGTLYWGRLSRYPFWPCILCQDPEGKLFKKKKIKIGLATLLHVRFFGDNGRRSWIHFENCKIYEGKDEFQKSIPKNFKIKAPEFKGYIIPVRQMEKWNVAVNEADLVFNQPIENRVDFFCNLVDDKFESRKKKVREKRVSNIKIDNNKDVLVAAESIKRRLTLNNTLDERDLSQKKFKTESSTYVTINDNDEMDNQQKKNKSSIDDKIFNDIKKAADKYIRNDSNVFKHFPKFEDFLSEIKNELRSSEENPVKEKELMQMAKQIWSLSTGSENNSLIGKVDSVESGFDSSSSDISCLNSVGQSSDSSGRKSIYTHREKNRKIKKEELSLEESTEIIQKMIEVDLNRLLKTLNREMVCRVCQTSKNLFKCSGICCGMFHKECIFHGKPKPITSYRRSLINLSNGNSDAPFDMIGRARRGKKNSISPMLVDLENENHILCNDCSDGKIPACFICNIADVTEGRIKCNYPNCGRFYHENCLKIWPQTKNQISRTGQQLICPHHVCHTCISDDPQSDNFQVKSKDRLTKCVLCPTTYHIDPYCIPAGTEFLTATQIICLKHVEYKKNHINVNWCFLCTKGGSLVCCDMCPSAFHQECLKISINTDKYICGECETGRFPLYGELVWAKLGCYRWWPAIIVTESCIPDNVVQVKHNGGEFCVKFLGSNNYCWLNRGRVFLYQEEDNECRYRMTTKTLASAYKKALVEAQHISKIIKQRRDIRQIYIKQNLQPKTYVKIKMNRPVPPVKLQDEDLTEISACECDPNSESPCGPNSECLNRLLLTECKASLCPAGSRCENQRFEKRIYRTLNVIRTEGKGWGLVALEDIRAGDFIIEYIGEVINNQELERRIQKKEEEKDDVYYFLTINKDIIIDAGLKGNIARFMNHSCEPNCETQKWTVNGYTRIGLFAVEDIPAHTELTFNYNFECIGAEKKICHCGAPKCSGFIGSKWKDRRANNWESKKFKEQKVVKSLNITKVNINNNLERADKKRSSVDSLSSISTPSTSSDRVIQEKE